MERENNRDSVNRRIGDDIDLKVLSHLLDNGSLPESRFKTVRRAAMAASGLVAAVTSMDAGVALAEDPTHTPSAEGNIDPTADNTDEKQREDMRPSDVEAGGHSIIWDDESGTVSKPDVGATTNAIDVSMIVVADSPSPALFSGIALSHPGHTIDTTKSQPAQRPSRSTATDTTVRPSRGFIDSVTDTIDDIGDAITGNQDPEDEPGHSTIPDNNAGQTDTQSQAELPQSQPEPNALAGNGDTIANTPPKSIADVIRNNPELTPDQIADAMETVDRGIVSETDPDVYAKRLADVLNGGTTATATEEPNRWNGSPIEAAEPSPGSTPPVVDILGVESPTPEQAVSYAIAEQLGTEEINQYILEMVQSDGPIHLDELAELYKNRPDLAEPVDGVSYLVKPLATELDYYTFSPGTDIPERRALPEQVAFQKVWTTYYNYLVRYDPRFNQAPISNVEEGDAWSEEDHGEHDGRIPALDIRTVMIGGVSYSGPAFTHGGERNLDLEEEMLRMAARTHFTGHQLVKYMIYDPADIRSRVSDLDRQYPGHNSKSLVQPSSKGDHKDHIHIAFNVYGEEIKLPYRWESNQEGYRNTTWEEVLAMNADWYNEIVAKYGLAPDMTPASPGESETGPADSGHSVDTNDRDDSLDGITETPIDVSGIIVGMPEEETVFDGEPLGPDEDLGAGAEVQPGGGVNELAGNYEQIIDGSESLSEDQKQFYKDAALAMERVHIARPDLREINKAVKTSQMAVESGYGTSELAVQAWNFSGNKAPRDYDGPTYEVVDDDRDANGRLVPSKFIDYKKLWEQQGMPEAPSRSDIMAFSLEYNLEKFNVMDEVYGDSMRCAEDPFGFALGLVHDMQTCRVIIGLQGQPGVQSYATNKGYVEAVMDRIEDAKLDQVFNVEVDPEWRDYSAEIDRMQEEMARQNA